MPAALRPALELVRQELHREAHLLVARPRDLASHVHNALWLDEGDAGAAGALLARARQALGEQVWLRLVNRPRVDRSVLSTAFETRSAVWALAWSPTGDRLAAACRDGAVRLWDVARGTEIDAVNAGAGQVNSLDWSPDGAFLASGHDDAEVRLWDARSLQPGVRLEAEDPGVLALLWSPDGSLLAAGTSRGSVLTWDSQRSWRRRLVGRHEGRVYALAWAPGGGRLAAGDERGVIHVWNRRQRWRRRPAATLRDREMERRIAEILGEGIPLQAVLLQCSVMSLAWSPDGELVAAGSRMGTIRLWDPAACAVRGSVLAASLGVPALAWSPDGELLAWGSGEGQIGLADRHGKALVLPVGHDQAVRAVAWSPAGDLLASGSEDRSVRVWAAREHWQRTAGVASSPLGHRGSVFAVCWSGDGTLLASSGSDQTVRLWDAGSGDSRGAVEGLPSPALALAPVPEGVLLAPTFGNRVQVKRWNGATRVAEDLFEITGPAFSLAVSPDGRWVASGDSADTIWLREVATGEPAGVLIPPFESGAGVSSPVWALAWSPQGDLLASSSQRAIVVWDVASRTPRCILDDRGEASTGDRHAGSALGFEDHQAAVIGVAHHGLAWSPDGRSLSACAKGPAIRIWNSADWRLERTLEGHRSPVTALAWSCRGKLLASGSSDCTVRLWEVETGTCIAVSQLLSAAVALRFAGDGLMIQAADDGTATANRPIPYEMVLSGLSAATAFGTDDKT